MFAVNLAGRIMLKMMEPSGLDVTLQPHLVRNKVARWNPPGNAATLPGVDGSGAPTALGTATARNVAAGAPFFGLVLLGVGGSRTPARSWSAS